MEGYFSDQISALVKSFYSHARRLNF